MKLWMIVCVALSMTVAFANDAALIKDMEALRNSLPFKDPGRPTLTRRLADLYFEKSVVDDKNLILTGKGDASAIRGQRERSLKLYQEALDGERGTFAAPQGELQIKIQFQMARLERMNGARVKALPMLQAVANHPQAGPDLKREALLTVAEMQDEDGKWKESHTAYSQALPLCKGAEAVSYVRYRIAWAYFRAGELARAQEEITHALYDGQGRAKEQVMADYIQFLAATPQTDGKDALVKIEALAQKARMPQLLEDLGNAFFAAGNRTAGVNVIAHVHQQNPSAFHGARLVEEYYGFRRWEDMLATLETLPATFNQLPSMDAKRRDAIDQILRRLVVQLDGERKSNLGKFAVEACLAIDVYLAAFPNSDVKLKMQEGWLAAQPSDSAKLSHLGEWLRTDSSNAARWHKERAAIAAKTKDHKLLRSEAIALGTLSKTEADRREWLYVAAKAAMDDNQNSIALTEFQEIARVENGSPDKWAIQSQNLALDLLNSSKDYAGLAAQASSWTNRRDLQSQPSLKADLAAIEKIRQEALFEGANQKGESTDALTQFVTFCVSGQFADKACPNARVLAVKLKRQQELVQVLEVQKDEEALAVEYERMGRFAEAARLQEKKLTPAAAPMMWLKVALLYQIGEDQASQQRVLRGLAKNIQKQKTVDAGLEPALRATFVSAGFTTAEMMALPWSSETKLSIAALAEDRGEGNAQTRQLVAQSKTDAGPQWAKLTMERLDALDAKQKAVGFYGRQSKALFQKRLKLIGDYAREAKTILPGAGTPVRVYVLDRLVAAYAGLEKEIMETPLPAGMDAEQLAQVQAALQELSAPIRSEREEYARLETEQMETLGAEASAWESTIAQGSSAVHARLVADRKPSSQPATIMVNRESALAKLASDPENRAALVELRDAHQSRGEEGPSAYFSGRLAEMEKL